MGSSHPFVLSPTPLYINPTKTSLNPNFSFQFPHFFSSKPRWDTNSHAFRRNQSGFGSGRRVREKRRNWWSDDEDDDDDEEEDDDDDAFRFWEEPSAIDWVFKILGAFGWMIPAVIISAFFGDGSNSLIMALVLPLSQTALSLVMDKLWVGPSSSPTPRPKPRRNPSNRTKKSKGGARGPRTSGTHQMNGNAKKSGGSELKFGGWDELDEQNNVGVPKEKAEGLEKESRAESVKLSVRRKSEKPLFTRLLIAVFPFLGSWSRFFF